MEKQKRRFGDRKDGYLLRDQDAMHFIMPLIYPNRCDNEAYIAETVDLTNINAFLAEKNAGNPVFKYTMFHLVVAALLKTIVLRPKLNRFISLKGKVTYYRKNSDNSTDRLDKRNNRHLFSQLFQSIQLEFSSNGKCNKAKRKRNKNIKAFHRFLPDKAQHARTNEKSCQKITRHIRQFHKFYNPRKKQSRRHRDAESK